MKKRFIGVLLVFLVVMSTLVYAASESSDNCSGFWGSIKCFLWGNPDNRAGKSWWDRSEALVGKGAYGETSQGPEVPKSKPESEKVIGDVALVSVLPNRDGAKKGSVFKGGDGKLYQLIKTESDIVGNPYWEYRNVKIKEGKLVAFGPTFEEAAYGGFGDPSEDSDSGQGSTYKEYEAVKAAAPPPVSTAGETSQQLNAEGDELLKQKKYDEAKQKYEAACDGGSMKGCGNLGYLHQTGQGVAIDTAKALELYKKACDGNDANGCIYLGRMYESEQGMQDTAKALELYKKACDGGVSEGCNYHKMLSGGSSAPAEPAAALPEPAAAAPAAPKAAKQLSATVSDDKSKITVTDASSGQHTYTKLSETADIGDNKNLPVYQAKDNEQFVFVGDQWRQVKKKADGGWTFVKSDGSPTETVGEADTSDFLKADVVTVESGTAVAKASAKPAGPPSSSPPKAASLSPPSGAPAQFTFSKQHGTHTDTSEYTYAGTASDGTLMYDSPGTTYTLRVFIDPNTGNVKKFQKLDSKGNPLPKFEQPVAITEQNKEDAPGIGEAFVAAKQVGASPAPSEKPPEKKKIPEGDPKKNWKGDMDIAGLPGDGQVEIKKDKFGNEYPELDCGSICTDQLIKVDKSGKYYLGWTEDGWKQIPPEVIEGDGMPNVPAKTNLMQQRQNILYANQILAKLGGGQQAAKALGMTDAQGAYVPAKVTEFQQNWIDTNLPKEHFCEGDKCWTDDKKKVEVKVTCIGGITAGKCTPTGKVEAKTELALHQAGQTHYESTAAELENLLSGYTTDDDEAEFQEKWNKLSAEDQAAVAAQYEAQYGESLEAAVKDKSDIEGFQVAPTEMEKAKAKAAAKVAAAAAEVSAKELEQKAAALVAQEKAELAKVRVETAKVAVESAQAESAQKSQAAQEAVANVKGAERTKEAEDFALSSAEKKVAETSVAKTKAEEAEAKAQVALEGATARAAGATSSEKAAADAAVEAAKANVVKASEEKAKAQADATNALKAQEKAEKKVNEAAEAVVAAKEKASAATAAETAAKAEVKTKQDQVAVAQAAAGITPTPPPTAPAPAAPAKAPAPTVKSKTKGWEGKVEGDNIVVTTPKGTELIYTKTKTTTSDGKTVYQYGTGAQAEYYTADGTRVNDKGEPIKGGKASTVLGTQVTVTDAPAPEAAAPAAPGAPAVAPEAPAGGEAPAAAPQPSEAETDIQALQDDLAKKPGGATSADYADAAKKAAGVAETACAGAGATSKGCTDAKDAAKRFADQSTAQKDQRNWLEKTQEWSSLAGSFGSFMSKLGSYQGLSNLLFPDTTNSWIKWANTELVDTFTVYGINLLGIDEEVLRAACDYDEAKRSKSPGQSAVFILDPYGTAQSVGAIQAEKSDTKSPILCERETDPETELEWKCAKKQICGNDFCYPDEDEDGEPDSEDPVKGYFYKITWGVTAPADQANTPYVDEDGIAVKFNIVLKGEKETWIFKKVGTPKEQVLELKNGASDGGVIVKYLPENYNEVCVEFYTAMKDIDGDEIDEFCADFIESDQGVVEYGGSDRTSSVTSSSPEVEMNI